MNNNKQLLKIFSYFSSTFSFFFFMGTWVQMFWTNCFGQNCLLYNTLSKRNWLQLAKGLVTSALCKTFFWKPIR